MTDKAGAGVIPITSTMDYTDQLSVCVAPATVTIVSDGQAEAPSPTTVQSAQMLTADLGVSGTEDSSGESPRSQVVSKKPHITPKAPVEGKTFSTSTPKRPSANLKSAKPAETVTMKRTFKFEGDDGRDSHRLRTATVILPPNGAIYNRSLFVNHLKQIDCLNSLEACGLTLAPHIWQFTFEDESHKSSFEMAGNFAIGDGLKA